MTNIVKKPHSLVATSGKSNKSTPFPSVFHKIACIFWGHT